jgi:S1-C subfamily serine protease
VSWAPPEEHQGPGAPPPDDAQHPSTRRAPWAAPESPGGSLQGGRGALGPGLPERPLGHGAGQDAPGQGRSRVRWLATVVVSAAVGAGVAAGVSAATQGPSGVTIEESNSTPGAGVAGSASIPALVHRVLPEVVTTDVRSARREEQGTGMIISSNGMVVTNDHVVRLALETGAPITVSRAGSSRRLRARLVGASAANDVALLRIEGVSGLPAVTFGDSNKLVVGDAVVAIGNALGLGAGTPTVTQGIVSALGRTVTAGGGSTTTETLTDMIQTDAAINPGNSGGPLIDSNGHVVGMNTAVADSTVGGSNAQNIGFAIPSATIEALVPGLERPGKARGAYLGAVTETLTGALRSADGLSPRRGAVVVGVLSGSPAAAAGLQRGDVIVALDTRRITSSQQLSRALRRDAVGQAVAVTFYRGAREKTVSVTLASLRSEQPPSGSGGARAVAP